MKALIGVYKPFGASVVRRVLGLQSSEEVEVRGVGQRSSVPSVGYWAVRYHHCRAIVVVDAESTYPDVAEASADSLQDLMIYPSCVTMHMAVPELSIVLFASPEHLAATLGVEITQAELIRAEYVPGEILDCLVARSPRIHSRDELIERIDDEYADRVRAHPLMRNISCSLAQAIASPIDILTGDEYYSWTTELLPT
jgi:hypothetical protein